jgi:hypothetical protein
MQRDYSNPKKIDIWDRRSGIDRRKVFIPRSEPERRFNQERRSGQDRRIKQDHRNVTIARRYSDLYEEVSKTHKGISLAAFLSLSLWALIIIFFLIFIISKSR